MIKACVFDMDGTLANTIETIAYYGNKALLEYGLCEIEVEKYKYLVGNGYIQLIKNMFAEIGCDDDVLFSKVAKKYDDMYNGDYMYKTCAYDGIIPMLKELKADGYKIGVVSNKPHDILKNIVGILFDGIEFDGIEGGRENIPLKPAPAMLLKMLIDMGVSKRECAYFGDTSIDMKTGNCADVNTIGVLWGFREKKELEDYGAHFIISHPKEVLPLIKRL